MLTCMFLQGKYHRVDSPPSVLGHVGTLIQSFAFPPLLKDFFEALVVDFKMSYVHQAPILAMHLKCAQFYVKLTLYYLHS